MGQIQNNFERIVSYVLFINVIAKEHAGYGVEKETDQPRNRRAAERKPQVKASKNAMLESERLFNRFKANEVIAHTVVFLERQQERIKVYVEVKH